MNANETETKEKGEGAVMKAEETHAKMDEANAKTKETAMKTEEATMENIMNKEAAEPMQEMSEEETKEREESFDKARACLSRIMMKTFNSARGQRRESVVKAEVGSVVVAKRDSGEEIRKGDEWVLSHCEGTSVGIRRTPDDKSCVMMSDLDFSDIFEDGYDPALFEYRLTDDDYEEVCAKMERDIFHLAKGTALECTMCGTRTCKEELEKDPTCQFCGYDEFEELEAGWRCETYATSYEISDNSQWVNAVDEVVIRDYRSLSDHMLVMDVNDYEIRVYDKEKKVVYRHEISDDTLYAVLDRAWYSIMEIVNQVNKEYRGESCRWPEPHEEGTSNA